MVKIQYGLFDITASDDSTQACDDTQPFSDVSILNTPDLDRLTVKPWATLEQNQWILDGSKIEFPNEPQDETWGLWSLQQSDENGDFATPIVLNLTFTQPHTTVGTTFIFREDSNDYPKKMTLDYYNSAGDIIASGEFFPDVPNYFAEIMVEDFQKIVATFYGTSLPHRYLKITEVKYGMLKTFDDNAVISAKVLEEINPTGTELSINTLEFTAYTTDFALLDPNGVYAALQQKQAINAQIDGRDFGTFFLDGPESEDDDTTTFKCVDFIGVIDGTNFKGGIYFNKNAGELISEIMTSAELLGSEYEVDETIAAKTVSGYIPVCTHREALQQVAFAVGAIVDCSRGKAIKIYAPIDEPIGTITHDDKFTGHTVKLTALVSGVEVTAHKYTLAAEAGEVFRETLEAGTHTVIFDSPMAQLTATGAAITESGANYAKITVTAAGEVSIIGKEYEDNTSVIGIHAAELPANAKPNVISIDEKATLISSQNAAEIAQRLYNYYQNRYTDEGDIILTDQKVGDVWTMNSLNNRDLQGRLERLEIDLITETGSMKLTGKAQDRG